MINPELEQELQRYLAKLSPAEQRKVLDFAHELTTKARNTESVDSLNMIVHIYEGMSQQDIDAIEAIILNRGPFFSRETDV